MPKKPGGSVGAILQLRSLGLTALELGWVQSVRVSEATCVEIRRTGAEQDVKISVHAPYFINLNASDDEWPNSRKRLIDAAYYGNLAGATDIVFHPGSYFGMRPEEILPKAINRLADCVAELRKQGNPVTLRPETMGKSAMLGSLEDTLAMSHAIPGVVPCLDFAHLHARPGDGTMNTYGEWCQVLNDYAKTLGDAQLKHLHCHLSGIQYSKLGERKHVPIQESDLNLEELFRALRDCGAGGRIMCESPDMENDALYMQSVWGKINQ